MLDNRDEQHPLPIATCPMPSPDAYKDRGGRFGAHNIHENTPSPTSWKSDEIVLGTFFNGGLRAYDISNPYQPKEVGTFSTAGAAAWERWPRSSSTMSSSTNASRSSTPSIASAGGLYILEMEFLSLAQWSSPRRRGPITTVVRKQHDHRAPSLVHGVWVPAFAGTTPNEVAATVKDEANARPSAFPSRAGGAIWTQAEARGARIPVTVITGVLGAGKTTLLRHFLATPEGRNTAVVINEFGAVGIDDALVRDASESTTLLGNGCVCCITRSDLQIALRRLVFERERGEAPPFDRIVIETSGFADPAPILQTFSTDRALGGEFFIEVSGDDRRRGDRTCHA